MKEIKIKKFSQELSIIEKFENYENQIIIIENCEGQAYITKSKNEFQLVYDGVFNCKKDKKIKIKLENTDFIFQSIDFKEAIDDRLAKIPAQHTFDIDKFYKRNIDKVALFKMFFFDTSKRTNIFHTKTRNC